MATCPCGVLAQITPIFCQLFQRASTAAGIYQKHTAVVQFPSLWLCLCDLQGLFQTKLFYYLLQPQPREGRKQHKEASWDGKIIKAKPGRLVCTNLYSRTLWFFHIQQQTFRAITQKTSQKILKSYTTSPHY